MKVCLVNPVGVDDRDEGYEYISRGYNYPHLGLGYIASVLESETDIFVEIIECMGQDMDLGRLLKRIEEEKYDAVGVSVYYYNFINATRIIKRIKKLNAATFLFAGGYMATHKYDMLLNDIKELDCCVLGEGEYTCLELMKALSDGKDWKQVPGIAYRRSEGIVRTAVRPLISNLDELPIPKRAFVSKRGMASIITSRGCYGNCSFCGVRDFYGQFPGKTVRFRSPEKVVDEIEFLVRNYNVNYISIEDDSFLSASKSRKKWLTKFYNLLKERGLNIRFYINARADEIENSKDILEQLKEVGLNCILVGIESFVKRQLDFYNKKIKVESNINAINILYELGIEIYMGFIMLDPFTTIDEILENVRVIRNSNLFKIIIERQTPISCMPPLYPIHDTPFYRYMKNNELLISGEIWAEYEFQNEDVKLYWDIIRVWQNKISPLFLKSYLILKAKEQNNVEIMQMLKKEREKLFQIDLDFIEKLCFGIKKKKIDLTKSNELAVAWDEELKAIYDKFIEAQQLLDASK